MIYTDYQVLLMSNKKEWTHYGDQMRNEKLYKLLEMSWKVAILKAINHEAVWL